MSNVRAISIVGLNKADVLAALYNGASPRQAGFRNYDPKPMTREEAEKFLPHPVVDGGFVDYLKGRPLKIWFQEDETIEAVCYDGANGAGLAKEIIDGLKATGQTYHLATQALHLAHTAMNLQEIRGPFDVEAFIREGMAQTPNLEDEGSKPVPPEKVSEKPKRKSLLSWIKWW